MAQPIVILGIDPGTINAGYALLEGSGGRIGLRAVGCLQQKAVLPLQVRVAKFYHFFLEQIQTYKVTHLCLETPFLGKSPQTFLKLGYLRGLLYLLAEDYKLVLTEATPRQVKMAITGSGSADKLQVQAALLLYFPALAPHINNTPYDLSDALAVGLYGLLSLPHSDAARLSAQGDGGLSGL